MLFANGCQITPQTWQCLAFSSASPIHPCFAKYAILVNPESFSSLNYKWVWTSDLLIGEEVEVGHLVPWQVEVVSSRTPVLNTPDSAASRCPHLAHILGWSS